MFLFIHSSFQLTQYQTEKNLFTFSLACLSSLEHQPGRHDQPVSSTYWTYPNWVDGSKQTKGNHSGTYGQEMPEELQHASRPVEVSFFWISVPTKKLNPCNNRDFQTKLLQEM